MRIASLEVSGTRRFGVVVEDSFTPLRLGQDPLLLLDPQTHKSLSWDEPVAFSEETELHAPLPFTTIRDFITFEQHTAGSLRAVTGSDEVPEAWFEAPAFYFTNPHAVVGSGTAVPIPPGSQRFDFELEVGVVIGEDGYNLSVEAAWDHIAGFTIFNDWSARDLQQAEMRVGLGPAKGKDTVSTVGPTIVTKDELEPFRTGDRYDLAMAVYLNDELIGRDTLANMAWSFAELISYASRGTWVKRGDLLGSGTAGGGCLAEFWGWNGTENPRALQEGDQVTMEVEALGMIHNRVVEGPALHPVSRAERVVWERPSLSNT